MSFGITGRIAPVLNDVDWLTAGGERRGPLSLDELGNGYKVLYFFQNRCEGCHASGFPSLVRLVNALAPSVAFAAIQTVFEDFERNTFGQVRINQRRYDLRIPFGHAAPRPGMSAPVIMNAYRPGGTPWFVLIDPKRRVLFDGFGLNVDAVISGLHPPEDA